MTSSSLHLAALVFTLASTLTLSARADTEDEPDDSYSQCAALSVGVAAVGVDGSEYSFKYDGGPLPAAEVGYGFCGPHTEFGVRARFLANGALFVASPALLLRFHTRTPADKGTEVGIGARVGSNFVHGSEFAWSDDGKFDGSGLFVGLGPDVRVWLNRQWAWTGAFDVAVGGAGDQAVYALAITMGGMFRW